MEWFGSSKNCAFINLCIYVHLWICKEVLGRAASTFPHVSEKHLRSFHRISPCASWGLPGCEWKLGFINQLKEIILLRDLSEWKGSNIWCWLMPFPVRRHPREMKSHSNGVWCWVRRPQVWCRGMGFLHAEGRNCWFLTSNFVGHSNKRLLLWPTSSCMLDRAELSSGQTIFFFLSPKYKEGKKRAK